MGGALKLYCIIKYNWCTLSNRGHPCLGLAAIFMGMLYNVQIIQKSSTRNIMHVSMIVLELPPKLQWVVEMDSMGNTRGMTSFVCDHASVKWILSMCISDKYCLGHCHNCLDNLHSPHTSCKAHYLAWWKIKQNACLQSSYYVWDIDLLSTWSSYTLNYWLVI